MKPREELIEKAKEILAESGLDPQAQNLWVSRFGEVSDAALGLFIKTFGENRELLPFATENLAKKLEAGEDPQKIEKIVEEEKAALLSASLKE